MTFEDWMLYQGLSESSTRKYVGAIEGALSTWAIENQLSAGPLISMTSSAAFTAFSGERASANLLLLLLLLGHLRLTQGSQMRHSLCKAPLLLR